MITGFLFLSFAVFLSFLFYPLDIAFDWESVFILSLLGFGFAVSFYFIFAHTAYNSEYLIVWTPFCWKKIKIHEITKICRNWESNGKGHWIKWYAYHHDGKLDKEKRTKLYLPEDYESKSIKGMISTIKKANKSFAFYVDISGYNN